MIVIRTDKDERYEIKFNEMLVQYNNMWFHLKGIFKLSEGVKFETLICSEDGRELFFKSKGVVLSIREE